MLSADSIINYLPGVEIDPAFNNNDGNPFLPPGSNQDVDIAIETSGIEHPDAPLEARDLVSTSRSLLPSILGTTKPAFWYIATGHQGSDQFFTHGGGFGTFYVNKISVPPAGQLSLQIEHSRKVDFEIKIVDRIQFDPGIEPPFTVPFTHTFTGTLNEGENDIDVPLSVWQGWEKDTIDVKVVITLKDPWLAQRGLRSEYVRTFTFDDPEDLEP